MNDCNVLLVEDNPVNQEVGRSMLEAIGCHVDIASNGYEVLDRIESTRYDMVFMDCQMPLMDGLEATRLIRQREKQQGKPEVTIVAITAHVADDDRSRCLDAGMNDYLGKPFRMQDLSQMMEKWRIKIRTPDVAASSERFRSGLEAPEQATEDCLDRRSLDNIRLLSPNGPRMLSAIIGIYLNDSPILLDRLDKTLDAADTDGMAKAAHALKSTSAGLGATALATICKQVEGLARGNSMDGAGELISRIRLEHEKVKEALRREVQRGF
jgi:CheY-like chemotaxis protein